jgi:thiol-disulfide isomerase/thioredoxin
MKPGTVVPDFTMEAINGNPVTLSAVQKDKTLLLFWASWCPACKEMMPFLKNWAGRNNIEVVAISLDTSASEWKNSVEQLGTESWVHLSDLKKWDGEVATRYNIYATPTLFIIDRERKIIAKPVKISDLER